MRTLEAMRITLAIVAALAMASCSVEDARWHADARFTADERVAIQNAFTWLSGASTRDMGGVAFDYEVTGAQPLAHTIRRERAAIGEHGVAGYCTDVGGGGAIYVDVSEAAGALDGLVAHELAHCELGLRDDPDSSGIMHRISPMAWTPRESSQLPP